MSLFKVVGDKWKRSVVTHIKFPPSGQGTIQSPALIISIVLIHVSILNDPQDPFTRFEMPSTFFFPNYPFGNQNHTFMKDRDPHPTSHTQKHAHHTRTHIHERMCKFACAKYGLEKPRRQFT